MGARKLDLQTADKLWQMCKTIDGKHVISPEAVDTLKKSNAGLSVEEATSMLRVYGKAAHACKSAQEFQNVLEKNEFPAIKLTQKEMEYVRGGAAAKLVSATTLNASASSTDSAKESSSCHGRSGDGR